MAGRQAPPATPQPCDLLIDGLATLVTDGSAAAVSPLRSAIDLFLAGGVSDDDWIQCGRGATTAAFVLWDFNSWAELSGRQVARARQSGALSLLVLALNLHPNIVTLSGDLEAATALVSEQLAVKEVTGIRMASVGAQLLAAYKGRPVDPSTVDEVAEHGEGYAFEGARVGTAVLSNGLGRYTEACSAAGEVVRSDSFFSRFALPELIEAAVRIGQAEAANDALRQLSEMIVEQSDWATGVEARCRALLTEGDEAEHWYSRSLAHLARTPIRIELARTQLLYGEWLRRATRRPDAATNCAAHMTCSHRWAPDPSLTAPVRSCSPPARRSVSATLARNTSSRRRNNTSPGSRATATPIGGSALSCSSVLVPLSAT